MLGGQLHFRGKPSQKALSWNSKSQFSLRKGRRAANKKVTWSLDSSLVLLSTPVHIWWQNREEGWMGKSSREEEREGLGNTEIRWFPLAKLNACCQLSFLPVKSPHDQWQSKMSCHLTRLPWVMISINPGYHAFIKSPNTCIFCWCNSIISLS